MQRTLLALFAFLLMSLAVGAQMGRASEEEKPVKVDYRFTPPAPREQSEAAMMAKSEGCYSCHVSTDRPPLHATPAVRTGRTDCPGVDAAPVRAGQRGGGKGGDRTDRIREEALQ